MVEKNGCIHWDLPSSVSNMIYFTALYDLVRSRIELQWSTCCAEYRENSLFFFFFRQLRKSVFRTVLLKNLGILFRGQLFPRRNDQDISFHFNSLVKC